jgi:sulfide:quinone oxidoreductase
MDRFRVVIAGGGVAALEGLLRLRRLRPDPGETAIAVLAPNEEFSLRALSVKEPFGIGSAKRYPVPAVVADHDAELIKDSLSWVDLSNQMVNTHGGLELPFDALLLAVGGVISPAFPHTLTFRDSQADTLLGGLIRDVENGYSKRIAFVAADGPLWMLPLYELAMMTAERADSLGLDDVEVTVATPEPWPLAGFGDAAKDAVTGLLEDRGVELYTSATAQVPAANHLLLQPHGVELHPDRIVAMPRVAGPAVRGIPGGGAHGFVPVDSHCMVPNTGGVVFAAGDATAFPVKHGGLSAHQADTAAAGIARLAGAELEIKPLFPELRGILLTGREPLYLRAWMVGGQAFRSEVSNEPLWSPPEKVSSEELAPYLASMAPSPT